VLTTLFQTISNQDSKVTDYLLPSKVPNNQCNIEKPVRHIFFRTTVVSVLQIYAFYIQPQLPVDRKQGQTDEKIAARPSIF